MVYVLLIGSRPRLTTAVPDPLRFVVDRNPDSVGDLGFEEPLQLGGLRESFFSFDEKWWFHRDCLDSLCLDISSPVPISLVD